MESLLWEVKVATQSNKECDIEMYGISVESKKGCV